ncbi:MAG: hypothetical protein ACXAEU_17375 [Candidatus Hodarchaeales archaeon]|jgi:DNA repair exonuclease SbcCD ATPase subunit
MSFDEEDNSSLTDVIIQQKLKEFMEQTVTPKLEELTKQIGEESTHAKENAVREMGFSLGQFQQQLKSLEDEKESQKSEIKALRSDLQDKKKKIKQLEQSVVVITDKISADVKNSLNILSSRVESDFSKNDRSLIDHGERLQEQMKSLESLTNEFRDFSNNTNDNLESLTSRIDSDFKKNEKSLTEYGERLQKLAKGIELLGSQMTKWQKDTDRKLTETKTTLSSNIDQLSGTLQEVFEGLNQELEVDRKSNAEKFEQIENNVNEQFQKVIGLINSLKEENTSDHTRIDSTTSQLDEFIGNIKQFIETLREDTLASFGEVKSDQKVLMQRFQRIVMGTAETLRNENVIIAKEVRGQLDTISKDFASNFYSIEAGNKLEDRTKNLGEELKDNSEKIRNQLVDNIDDAIKQFQEATKEAIASVNEVKLDIENYKDEILSLIERKVNEKYDFLFDILGNLLTKSEQLKIIVRDSKLVTPEKTPVAIDPEKT